MKTLLFRSLLISSLVLFSTTNCSTGASLLSSGSKLMTALASNGALSEFTKLLKTPGLDKILGSILKKPFTMLAPTNEALAGLGSDMLNNLMKPENLTSLGNLLKRHIVPGKMSTSDLQKGGVKTSDGKMLDVSGITLGKPIQDQDFNIIPIDKVIK
jgi:uncharacterized surface protein with fasciclin (FAS1) repeats